MCVALFLSASMPDLCPNSIDMGVKPSAPPCPLILPLYPELQAEQTESQGTPIGSWIQTEIPTAQVEVQTTPVSVKPQTTLAAIETQTIEVREAQTVKTKGEIQNEIEDMEQRDKEKQVSPIYPWNYMHRAAREAEEQPHKLLLPLHEAPTRRNNQSMKVNKPFSYQEIQRIKEDMWDYLEDPEKYISAFKGVTLFYDLTWKDVIFILRQTLTPD